MATCRQFGGTFTCTCNVGYVGDGRTTCTVVQCPALNALANGALSPTNRRQYQDQVTFTCNTGYTLVGQTSITCLVTGAWSASPPTCNPRTCPTLTAPTNGALNPPGPTYSYPNQVTVTCNPGYQLTGDSPLTCQADGTWDRSVGTCAGRTCPTLNAPSNGALNPAGPTYVYPSTVQVTCNPGYTLTGDSPLTCRTDGTWDRSVGTCAARSCPTLTAPANGALNPPGPYSYPSTVNVNCNPGYTLNGASPLTCQTGGTWDNNVGTCTPRACQTLTAPTNGALSPPGPAYSYPSTVNVNCNTGYQLTGVSPLTCQADGSWSSTVGTCQPSQCPVVNAPTNGARTPPTGSNSFGNMITFTCNTGYVLNGATSSTCQADTTWSPPVPTCDPRQCPALTAPAFGSLSPTGRTSYQDVVNFNCETGYVRNGAASATCQADGSWSNPVPTCTPTPCNALTAPTNGALSPTGPYTYPATVTPTCNTGYTLNGATTLTCNPDGSWNDTVPTCEAVQCPALTAPRNGTLTPVAASYNYQNTITFDCDRGFDIVGAADTTCKADGTWSNRVPTCRRKMN
ncbi:P-selectin-like [Branchiostoma floridae]|uniref:P-selectin-like n=1 Tax=Branchiostoma floridae TaxID=7739 RepID=A0A9J7KV98_BRAFL|nr:P-selectin-like [Branchiostoma floridae]